jgi:hypothetical protein
MAAAGSTFQAAREAPLRRALGAGDILPELRTRGAAVELLATDGCVAAIVLHTSLSQVADPSL